MANKKTRPITLEEYRLIQETIRTGFTGVRANPRIATALCTQANLGTRIGDTLKLTPGNFFVKPDGSVKLIGIDEEKTDKPRDFPVAPEFYAYITNYAMSNSISKGEKLFNVGERQVQEVLKKTVEYLGLDGNISTHSFRKLFGMQIYINNDYNIELVREVLQHSSVVTTQRYLQITAKTVEKALLQHIVI